MKTQFSALDLACMIKELQCLVGAKVDNIYHQNKEIFFQFHLPNEGKKQLRILVPNVMYVTQHKGTYPEKPSGFCMFLRKYLLNARVKRIQQQSFERIAVFTLETKSEIYVFYAEFFTPGNILLCSETNEILACLEQKSFSTRTIKPHEYYTYPQMKYNFLNLTESQLKECIDHSPRESLVKTLAIELGLGGLYAEELCVDAGIDKSKKHLTSKELDFLYASIKKLRHLTMSPSQVGTEIVPLELVQHQGKEKKSFETFSELLDVTMPPLLLQPKNAASEKELAKIMYLIEQQQQHRAELQQQVAEEQHKGEYIYHQYQEIKALLDEIAEKGIRNIKNPAIKKVNEKDKEIVVEL